VKRIAISALFIFIIIITCVTLAYAVFNDMSIQDVIKSFIRYDFKTVKEITNTVKEPKTEVAAARAVVEEYYRAVAAKDAEAILATMYPREYLTMERVKSGYVQLYGTEKRTLLTIDYDSQDSMRESYKPGGKEIAAENIIVFKVSFNIEYPLKDGGPWNEGIYDNWSMILIRDNENSPWLIYDQGY